MTGDFGCEGISSECLTDGLARFAFDGFSDEAVSADLAARNATGGLIDLQFKGGGWTLGIHRKDLRLNGLAEPTGLEPATSAVTGRRSNQLSYSSRPNPSLARGECEVSGFYLVRKCF